MTERRRFYNLDIYSASRPFEFVDGNCLNCFRGRCPKCNVLQEDTVADERVVVVTEEKLPDRYAEAIKAEGPILRQDLVNLWRASGLTGFRTAPVRLIRRQDRAPLNYPAPSYQYVILESNVRLLDPPITFTCNECGFRRYAFEARTGLTVDLSTWDGSDFFRPAFYTNLVLCTERAARITLEAGYNEAIAFIRAESFWTWEPFDARTWGVEEYVEMRNGYLIRDPSHL